MIDCVVIGGGPAGMMASYSAARRGKKVLLIEKNEKMGKKIYLTGKGRCNLTNDCDERQFLENIFENRNFLFSSVYTLPPRTLMELLKENGLKLKVERGERVFPLSDKASDVTKTLTSMMAKVKVDVRLNTKAESFIISDGELKGLKLAEGEIIECSSVILCSGGRSYPSTGSDGFGYTMAAETGHKIIPQAPALTSFICEEEWIENLAGLSLKNVSVSLFNGNKKVSSQFGEMLFTHRGISGPIVLTLSCQRLKYPLKATIDLKPALDESVLDARIQRDFKEVINREFKNSLGELLPLRLCPLVVKLSGIAPDKKVNQITQQERKLLVKLIKNLPVKVIASGGYEEAIVTQGGVDVKDINPSTMESKIIKGLYFAGEVISAHGYTGGFNMHAAFSTGYLAGLSV